MRVIAGTARRLQLETPAGLSTRPTSDMIKETLFNILQPQVADAVFLDLFAGSGGIGIEALSRGARHCCFADSSKDAIQCIRHNLNHTKLADQATVYASDYTAALVKMRDEKRRFDIVFLDPPYGKELELTALRLLREYGLLNDDAIVIVEVSSKTDIDEINGLGYRVDRVKEYKTNCHWFLTEGV
ncbi:MAG: 16S rRNA (guanine(966)-N(2))-methyltransferase RsmD [Lachnospiraceae bacterium]|nr:16S rRNA (guanine(966)-N(2))-methyltransferase RsmD [Lachnospiraceae bacterium]